MKAKDYFEQFGKLVYEECAYEEQETKQLAKLIGAFLREMKETMEARHVKTDRGCVATIKEQNEKWNALCAIFEKEYGQEVLKRNGFMVYMEENMPEMKEWRK